jgi:hypothetical protein
LLSASIYLWNYNHTVLAYVGFASVLSARHLLWTTLEGSLQQSLRMGRPSAGLALKLLLLAAPVYWFALSLQELGSSLEWRSLMLLVYPLLLRLSAQQLVPGIKEGAESLGYTVECLACPQPTCLKQTSGASGAGNWRDCLILSLAP